MRAGRLDKKITILSPTLTQSTVSGEQTITWSTYIKNRWASVEPLSMREQYNAAQLNARLDTRITMRYSTGITPQMRIVYDGSTYYIDSIIDPDERHKELQIMCSRVVT